MSDKQHDDALIDAYRRASASDADRPGAATRAAILAEAAAAARRNAPAANESRYWMRTVAGIAVLGIGVLLWRQTYDRLPVAAPVALNAPVKEDIIAERNPLPEKAPEPEHAAVKKRPTASARTEARALNEVPPPAVASPSPPQVARNLAEDNELAEIQITGTRIQSAKSERDEAAPAAPVVPPRAGGAAPAGGAGGGVPRTLDSAALLRLYFPEQYQSDEPHSVWLVLNATGGVLQSGELAAGQRLTDLAPQLAREFGERVPGPWQVQTLRNARGQLIELAIARMP